MTHEYTIIVTRPKGSQKQYIIVSTSAYNAIEDIRNFYADMGLAIREKTKVAAKNHPAFIELNAF